MENIKDFVDDCDVVQEGHVWKWELVHKEECVKRTIQLFILKEVVYDSRHESEEDPFCSYSGCNNNLVLKCKYHFVISADYESSEQLDDPFDKDDYFFKDRTHLLHGLLHKNGIGHLICINGGSASITGRDIMHL
ncbi:PHD finger protein MALE MEIOCYTE DEATH 1-like isoform X1 [Prunus yedoensis var. nudiflora]|uniref:PHD finger protein MALE MEIOCYTE DEATH 1-like isoform X1 n=1 Tax=Prunus yedoensis var. nudiflora TaxID=2094558 RepID=A0A314UJ45_PRUYE|nr:PHD finger protein MALE MEIOCYTE DEATH 1-like isoform X1 [Prunus yedoensis var. nudiflora]